MKCTRCGFGNPDGINFCGGCGAAVSRLCGSCGADNPGAFRFCGNCGSALSEEPGSRKSSSAEGERRQLTVMFCDLVGSTALSHRLDPEDLREVIRQYQTLATEIVDRFGGHVAQYLGDGLLVYFGYPRAHEDDARRAVEAGLEILSSVSGLNASIAHDGVSLALRIGVHTGPVVTGEIGRQGTNTENLALGATPNVAARVQAEAEPGSLLLTRATRALVRSRFELVDIGDRSLKGVTDPVRLYRVEGTVSAGREPAEEQLQRTPFVGRELEVRTMLSLLQQASEGAGRVLLIKGEPGMGKTRLQREVRASSAIGPEQWLTCHCSAYHQNTALYPVAQLVAQALGIQREDEPQVRRIKVRAGLADLNPATDAEDMISSLLGLPAQRDGAPAPNPVVRRKRTLGLVVDLLLQSIEARPRVIAFEDLHWSDPSTLELLGLLVQRLRDAPVLAVMSYRPEFVPMWSPPSHQSVIELQRLNDGEAEAIVSAYREVPAALRRELVERTDGIPLFLEELTRSVLERGVPTSLEVIDQQQVVPETLRDLLMARLDSLGSAKEMAQLGALLGRRFRFEVLAAVIDTTDRNVRDSLQRVVDSGLLIRTGELPHATFMFKHALVQDVAYRSLLLRRRRELHDQVARCLVARFPSVAENEPEILAWHYEEAGRHAEAVDAYRSAAGRALAASAYDEAIHHLNRALKSLTFEPEGADRDAREIGLLQMMGPPLSARYGYTYPELERLYSRTLELVGRSERQSGLTLTLFNIWAYRAVRGERRSSAEAAEKLRAAASGGVERDQDLAAYALGSNAFFLGEPERALGYLSPIAERIRSRTRVASPDASSAARNSAAFLAWVVQCWGLALAGYLDQAWDSICEVVDVTERSGDPFALAQALTHQAMVSHELARPAEEIAAIARRTHAISEEQGLAQTLQSSRLHIGWAAAVLGRENQTSAMRDSIDATRTMGTLIALPHRLMMLAETHVRLGQSDEALAVIDECLVICETNGGRVGEPDAHRLRGVLLAGAGDVATAEISLARSIDIARARRLRLDELRATTALAGVLRELGRGAEVENRLTQVLGWFAEGRETTHVRSAAEMLRRIRAETAGSVS
ncbi:MAG: adenylate/guanylate cyclase domain-containing protein [Pseudomonadales bacterium]